jgi:hypothetical protein
MKKSLLILAFVMSFGHLLAQKESVWHTLNRSDVSKLTKVRTDLNEETEQYFSLDVAIFKQSLVNARDKFSGQNGVVVEFPNRNGEIEKFNVWENSNMEPDFQAQFPQIRAYVGKGITDPGAIVNFSVSPQGIQTILFRANSTTEFIESYDKQATAYILFDSTSRSSSTLICTTDDVPLNIEGLDTSSTMSKANNLKYKTMRLALSCTAEYSAYFGASTAGTVADKALVLAGMNATMTRVNGIYEKDLAVHLNMIDNTNVIFYDAATDPYSSVPTGGGAPSAWNTQLQNTLSSRLTGIGTTLVANNAAYDIGHLFGASGGGGNAGCIGCVCVNDTSSTSDKNKGSGYTSPSVGTNGLSVPAGDFFDIDFVAHEMGHQLGGNHTFSYGGSLNVSNPEVSVVCVETGSGSTIMAYAGVASDEDTSLSYNVQLHSDPFFTYRSVNQIQTNLNTKTCPVTTTLVDNVPVVNAGTDYTIPMGTAFVLTGTASDADASDVLNYVWEQNDLGTIDTIGASSYVTATKDVGPTFRTFKPSTNLFRYFPQMGKILNNILAVSTGSTSNWESVSNVARTLNFTFTARDNHVGGGQTQTDATVITVNTSGGPFTVTSQSTTGISYVGNSTQTVTWNVANTTAAPFNTSTVDILVSTNASSALETFNATTPTSPNPTAWTTIASGVPNTGSYVVTVPDFTTSKTTCRFMVKAVGNVFLAVNSKNFTITPSLSNETFGWNNFSLYPNPNKGNFSVQFDSTSTNDISISVNDIRGRSIFEKSYPNTGTFDQNIQLESVQSGIYLVNIQDGDKKVVKKIVIE